MNNKEFLDQVLDERKFLHDMSNKLMIAQGMSTFISRSFKESNVVMDKDRERCEKLVKSVTDMADMLKVRRDHLHRLSE